MSRYAYLKIVLIFALFTTVTAWAVETDKSVGSHPVINQIFAEYEKAFNAGDAKAIGALWKTDGEFVSAAGDRIVGREAIEKVFQEHFSQNPGGKLVIKISSLKEEEPGRVAVAEIVPEVSPPPPGQLGSNKDTVVMIRSDEKWLIEGVRETPDLPASYEHLKVLEWLVGSWSTEALSGNEPDKEKQISINSSCRWTANKSFLIRTFSTRMRQLEFQGTEIIGWDPQAKAIRSWSFESTGGFTQSTWKPDGKKWIVEMKGVLANADAVSSTSTITKIDDDSITIQSEKRMRNGQPQTDIPRFTVYRVKQDAGD